MGKLQCLPSTDSHGVLAKMGKGSLFEAGVHDYHNRLIDYQRKGAATWRPVILDRIVDGDSNSRNAAGAVDTGR